MTLPDLGLPLRHAYSQSGKKKWHFLFQTVFHCIYNLFHIHVWSIRQVVEIIILAVICLICIIIRGRKCICMMHNVLRY